MSSQSRQISAKESQVVGSRDQGVVSSKVGWVQLVIDGVNYLIDCEQASGERPGYRIPPPLPNKH